MIATADPNALFRQAERAFAEGRPHDALPLLETISRAIGTHGAVLHLTALVHEQAGQFEQAAAAFEKARKAEPGDPQILNNYGNLLDRMGRFDEAVRAYEAAAKRAPDWVDPIINRALTHRNAGNNASARADLALGLAMDPANARGWAGLAAIERAEGKRDEAANAYDKALEISPGYPLALHGRARVAMERGEPDAAARFEAALLARPGDREVTLGFAESADAAGDGRGRETLAAALAADPGWLTGHEMLARFRAEAGEPDFARSYHQAIAALPDDFELRRSYWRTLVRANDYAGALRAIDAATGWIALRPEMRLEEAAIASEAGDAERAEAVLAMLPESADALLVAGRHALRRGDPQLAARNLEKVIAEDDAHIFAWAHLDIAWRMIGDARHEWLSGQGRLVGNEQLDIDPVELARLAQTLRDIHRSRAAPIGQSIRGGTQTRGRLFDRSEIELRRLSASIATAVESYRQSLPAADPRHPLLKHRDRKFRFDGSWSVRLCGGGSHINHIHPQGILSSACYIALPPADPTDPHAGWLELGAPPAELGIDLEPLHRIEPVPGRLALFPSILFHGTQPFAAGERLTVAFDLLPT